MQGDKRENTAHIITDLRKTQVGKGDPVVWEGFRIFEAVPDGGAVTPTRATRRLNALGNPPFDFNRDTLFDYGTILASKLGGADWRAYNRLCSVQVAECRFNCWHCYNDARPDPDKGIIDGNETAEFVLEKFEEQRRFDRLQSKQMNVLRITGGEPFLEPAFILECAREVEAWNRRPDATACAIWTETNLSPFVVDSAYYVPGVEKLLAAHRDNSVGGALVVHPCLHGVCDDEIRSVTETELTLDQLLQGLETLVRAGVDVFPTLHSNLNDPARLRDIFGRLLEIDGNLPLRVALVEISLTYEACRAHMRHRAADAKEWRPMLASRHAALFEWNELCLKSYGFGYGVLPRHLAQLGKRNEEGGQRAISLPRWPLTERSDGDRVANIEKKRLLLFKSALRDAYRQQALTVLGLPEGFIVTTEYDTKKWVAQDIACAAEVWPDLLHGLGMTSCFAESIRGGDGETPVVHAVRTGTILRNSSEGGRIQFRYTVGPYPQAPKSEAAKKNLIANLWPVFGEGTLPPTGALYAILAPEVSGLAPSEDANQKDADSFQRIVEKLSVLPRMERAAFCRLSIGLPHTLTATSDDPAVAETFVSADAGDVISLRVVYHVPNPEKASLTGDAVEMCIRATNPTLLKVIGPETVRLSRYGELEFRLLCGVADDDEDAEILIYRSDDETLAPFFRIPVRVSGRTGRVGKTISSLTRATGAAAVGVSGGLYTKYMGTPIGSNTGEPVGVDRYAVMSIIVLGLAGLFVLVAGEYNQGISKWVCNRWDSARQYAEAQWRSMWRKDALDGT